MDIFLATKSGNLGRVKELVEADRSVVNERYWDATPLYYACLCGHYEICVYLLDRGSNCAEDTFDGDRCLYGALTDDIRALLRRYSKRRTFVLGEVAAAVTKAYTQQADTDFEFVAANVRFPCHRFVIGARLPKFRKKFRKGGAWSNKPSVKVNINPTALGALLKYCYSDVVDCPVDCIHDFLRLCRTCGLPALARAVSLELVVKRTKPRLKKGVITDTITKLYPVGRDQMAHDFGKGFILFDECADFSVYCKKEVILVHSCIVFARSKFFHTLLSGASITSFRNPCELSLFRPVIVRASLMFLYTNGAGCAEVLWGDGTATREQKQLDIIEAFDLGTQCMLPRFCDLLAKLVESHLLVDLGNVLDWLRLASIYSNRDLRAVCFRIIARAMVDEALRENTTRICSAVGIDGFLKECANIEERNYYISEIREAFIESLPYTFDMNTRDEITDRFELELGYTGN
mmetsp:Transcript_13792/g.22506  ORF Transcript_13792/g.22506 Transcript_13792/m.22506 type:complete len:462 (+) Transcript_13792:1802-3187(+)